jgi:hypothetical protein
MKMIHVATIGLILFTCFVILSGCTIRRERNYYGGGYGGGYSIGHRGY